MSRAMPPLAPHFSSLATRKQVLQKQNAEHHRSRTGLLEVLKACIDVHKVCRKALLADRLQQSLGLRDDLLTDAIGGDQSDAEAALRSIGPPSRGRCTGARCSGHGSTSSKHLAVVESHALTRLDRGELSFAVSYCIGSVRRWSRPAARDQALRLLRLLRLRRRSRADAVMNGPR